MLQLLESAYQVLFGCNHRNYCFPRQDQEGTEYVVCLDCGNEFTYDWERMRAVRRVTDFHRPKKASTAKRIN
jgi:hypothetical protein